MELYLDSIQGENHTLHRFDFDTINIATEKFSEANKFLDYGYGSIYKGRLQNGQDIAVTLPSSNEYKRYKMHEASMLVKLEHENMIKLLGYCIKGTNVFLVSELAHHLSLHSLIFDPMCDLLDWNKRYKILLGVARVLVYLHKDAPITIIHGHLTSESILLDKSFNPKLSHFGFATEINETDSIPVNMVCGTISCDRGYTAPERLMKFNLSTKADVFNFGVVVLETITGYKISIYFQPDRPFMECIHRNWLKGTSSNIIDPRIDVDSSSMTKYLEIGLLCVQDDPVDRPTMEEIGGMLLGNSSLTLPVSKMRERMIRERSTCITEPVDDYDTSAVEDFISDLCPR